MKTENSVIGIAARIGGGYQRLYGIGFRVAGHGRAQENYRGAENADGGDLDCDTSGSILLNKKVNRVGRQNYCRRHRGKYVAGQFRAGEGEETRCRFWALNTPPNPSPAN